MTIKNCSSFHSLRLCLNFTNHMTSSVNTFKEKHQHHSDDVSKNKQNNWTRTGWSLTLQARQEVEQLVTGRGYFTEVGRTQGADPAINSDHLQEAGSCWTSEFFFWNLYYDQVRLRLRMMSIQREQNKQIRIHPSEVKSGLAMRPPNQPTIH